MVSVSLGASTKLDKSGGTLTGPLILARDPQQPLEAATRQWVLANGGGIPPSTVASKGDLIAATGAAAVTRVGVGSDGQVLTAASAQPTGLQWSSLPSSLPPNGAAGGDLSGTYPAPTVTGTHLAAPLPINQGGTGATAASAALAALSGTPISAVRAITAASVTANAWDVLECDATANAISVTMPTPTAGTRVSVKKMDSSAHAVTIVATVDGGANPTLAYQFQSMDMVADGTDWILVRPDITHVGGYPAVTDARYVMQGQAAGNDLSGNYPNPVVSKIQGVAISGIPSTGYVPTATGSNTATWQALPAQPSLPLSIANGGTGQASASAGFNALSPVTSLGDLIYGSAANTAARLAGNTSATRNFLRQTGTGTASAAPAWDTLQAGDLPAASTTTQGAVILDGTATDIAALGAQAAGAVGKAADAGHVHPTTGLILPSNAASTVQSGTSYGTASAVGASSNYAREDHQHGTVALASSAPATTLGIGQSAAVGTATAPARADHVHPLAASAAAGSSAVGDTAAAGVASTFAASDHRHARESFGAATAQTSYGAASGNGSATTIARSDHTHGTPSLTTTAPATTLAIGTAAALGTAVLPALADHVHPMAAAAAAGASAVGDVAAAGSATTFAASDHRHAREAFGSAVAATVFGAASVNGSALTVAHSDHVHGLPDAYSFDTPKQRGFSEWNFPPSVGVAVSQNFTSGTIYGVSLIAQSAATISKVAAQVVSSAATPTAGQNLIGFYTVSGGTATQQTVTGDLSTWGSAGLQQYALGASQTLTPGQTIILLFLSVATTPVHLQGITSDTAAQIGFLNIGLSNTAAPWFKFFVQATGQSALPASFTINGTTMNATNALAPWAVLL